MAKPPSRWVPRALVALTVLVCLGVGGYAGQAWWARKFVQEHDGQVIMLHPFPVVSCPISRSLWSVRPLPYPERFTLNEKLERMVADWETCPWYGRRNTYPEWIPKILYYEFAKQLTGQPIPNDPSVWKAWFKAHPNLVWDEKQKRLVDAPPAR